MTHALRYSVTVFAAALLLGPSMVSAADLAKGHRVYQQHCSNCHGPRGLSVMAGVPNFAKGEGLRQPDMMLVQMVKTGRKGQPPFMGILADNDILDALAYSRTLR